MNLVITINDAQKKALESRILDIQSWLENWVSEQARIEIENIVAQEVQRKLAVGETISGTKEEIVLAANIQSAAERKSIQDELDAQNAPQ